MSDPVQGRDGLPVGERDHVGTPRWAKVLAIMAAVIVALLVITQLLGIGGGHGPGRHGAAPPNAPGVVA